MDDSDDEDIPALPPIPANLKREKSRSQDPGRYLGMSDGHYVPPGTAITSDDLYSTAQPVAKSPKKRQSFSSMISKRKSGTDLQKQEQDTSGNKRKRRSWFSVHNPNDNSLDTALPPIPALPNATGSEDSTIDPSEMAFHRFLHNTHNARAQGATTDYERFLRASRAYDESMPSPPYISHSNSLSAPHASLPTATVPTMAPHPATLKRATYAAPSARRSHASRCRPQRQQDEDRPESRNHVFLSIEQQHEWNKLRDLLDDTIKTVSPESSLEGVEDDDEDGVIGMVRELNRNEEREARRRDERRRRDRERGYGAWANDEALARLEFGK